ncbi:hypothetical protein D3C76_160250 [compost metagenome]
MGRGQLFQRPQGTFRAEFLDESKHPVQNNDGDDRDGIQIFAEKTRNQRGAHQHQHHKILKLVQKQQDRGDTFSLLQFVPAGLLASLQRFFIGQALFTRDAEAFQKRFTAPLVPEFLFHPPYSPSVYYAVSA